ncbi:hypothetical protein NLJ89_g8463 [Agrocybe chaxingu]|uniref:Uncharacterized protein n=1 Tax=Agrocybe chaxingu TaxID=84603 RepID=A0A9W8JUM5_9AGAR|nr:hypothetical protein NLJ89_g8463 [Agrocybe chaxingu]
MGRRRLYNTLEEKNAANRAKSKRHYDKTKESINKRRRKEYRRTHPAPPDHTSWDVPNNQNLGTGKSHPCLERVMRIESKFDIYVNDDPRNFVDSICLAFLENRDKDKIHEYTVALGKFQKSVDKYQDIILQEHGIGDQWTRIEEIRKKICTTLSAVEEVFCYALVDWEEVRRIHAEGEFMYQMETL